MKIGDQIKAALGKLGAALQRFMAGRYGSDELSRTMMWAGIILLILDLFLRTSVLTLLGMAVYGVMLFRTLSKDREKRAAENRKYQAWSGALRTKFRQAKVRFANRKQYKYVRCPKCRAWIRLPRGAGAVTVRCKGCGDTFEQKA